MSTAKKTVALEVAANDTNPRWYMKYRPQGWNALKVGDKWVLMGKTVSRLSEWPGSKIKGAFLHDILFAPDGVRLILTK